MTLLPKHDQERSAQLTHNLRTQMAEGPMRFADYMDAALYTPELGYYASGDAIFWSMW